MSIPSSDNLRLAFETVLDAAEAYRAERTREFKKMKAGWLRMNRGREMVQERFDDEIAAIDLATRAVQAAAKFL